MPLFLSVNFYSMCAYIRFMVKGNSIMHRLLRSSLHLWRKGSAKSPQRLCTLADNTRGYSDTKHGSSWKCCDRVNAELVVFSDILAQFTKRCLTYILNLLKASAYFCSVEVSHYDQRYILRIMHLFVFFVPPLDDVSIACQRYNMRRR